MPIGVYAAVILTGMHHSKQAKPFCGWDAQLETTPGIKSMFENDLLDQNDTDQDDYVAALLLEDTDGPSEPGEKSATPAPQDRSEKAPTLEDVPDVPDVKFDRLNKRLTDGAYSLPSGSTEPIPFAPFEDPRVLLAAAKVGIKGKLVDENVKAFVDAISAADALDRVWLAQRITGTRNRLEALPHAIAFVEMDNLRTILGELTKNATEDQRKALGKMWAEVTEPPSADGKWPAFEKWLDKPENAAVKKTLEATNKWGDIKDVFGAFVAKNNESAKFPELRETDLTKNTKLRRDIKEVREKATELQHLSDLYLSSLATRLQLLDELQNHDDVKKFAELSAEQKAASELRNSTMVKAAIALVKSTLECFAKPTAQNNKALFELAEKLGVKPVEKKDK